MVGLIGKKVGMTSLFTEEGKSQACTVIEVEPNVVTQVKTDETDGYNAIQVGTGAKKLKNTTKAMVGHFKNANTEPLHQIQEFRNFDADVSVADTIAADLFEEGEIVDVIGTSKGKGFQGVVKRHGFGGVGMRTHGQHNRGRAPGSIGAASYPARVFKGMRMAGRMGTDRVTIKNLEVLKVLAEENLIVVKGAVPGHKGAYLTIVQK